MSSTNFDLSTFSKVSPGKRLKALRADVGMSQKELARHLGTPPSHLSDIEADKVPRVSGEMLAKIAEILGTTTDYLLGLTPDPIKPPEMVEEELPLDVRLLYQQIERLPPGIRDQAVEYLIEEIERMERLMAAGRRLGELRQVRGGATA